MNPLKELFEGFNKTFSNQEPENEPFDIETEIRKVFYDED